MKKEDAAYLQELRKAMATYSPMQFTYKDKEYRFEYYGTTIQVYENKLGTPEYTFTSPDDFLDNFMLDGKPFKECLRDID